MAARIAKARERQAARFASLPADRRIRTNAEADGALLDEIAIPDPRGPEASARRRRPPAPLRERLPPRLNAITGVDAALFYSVDIAVAQAFVERFGCGLQWSR